MSDGPLSHVKVLDLTHSRAGPFCTKLFSGFGAAVIKIERPRCGDCLRQQGPFLRNIPGVERSLPFNWLNTGKQSLTLDLKTDEGKDILGRLIERSDILVENFSPGVMERLSFGYKDVCSRNPGIIMTSISNFGQDGPYRDFRADEKVLYAMSGGMAATGDSDLPPLSSGPPITQYTAGLHAYIATLMALMRCNAEGNGEYIDVSIHESAIENIEIQLAEFLQGGKVARRNGDEHPLVPWRCYPCSDGYAAIIGGPLRHWKNAPGLFEEPRLSDPSLKHMASRIERRREVEAMIRPWLMKNKRKDIYHRGQALGLAFGYLANIDDILQSSQLNAREFFFRSQPHPEIGSMQLCGPVFRFAGAKGDDRRAPLLGEHNEMILVDLLGYTGKTVKEYERQEVI